MCYFCLQFTVYEPFSGRSRHLSRQPPFLPASQFTVCTSRVARLQSKVIFFRSTSYFWGDFWVYFGGDPRNPLLVLDKPTKEPIFEGASCGICTCKWDLQLLSPGWLLTDFPGPRGWVASDHSLLKTTLRVGCSKLSLKFAKQNSCVVPFFDQDIGRRIVPKLTSNDPKSAQWQLVATCWDQK